MRRDGLVEPSPQVGIINARRRREEVASCPVLQELRRLTYIVRIRRRIVHYGIPLLADERLEVAIAIAGQALDIVRQLRLMAATREDRHPVAARHGVPYQVRADESCPAKDEEIE